MYGNQSLSIFRVYMITDVPQLNYKIFLKKTKKTMQVKRVQGSSFEGKNTPFNVLPHGICLFLFRASHLHGTGM